MPIGIRCNPFWNWKTALELENATPSHDTFSRMLGMLDPEAFRQWFLAFMGRFAEGIEGVVASDGKTLRRSFDRAAGLSPLRLVSAWAEERRLVLGQVAVDDKSKPALINLLQYGDLADPPAYEVLDRRVRGLFPTETARRIADELARRSD